MEETLAIIGSLEVRVFDLGVCLLPVGDGWPWRCRVGDSSWQAPDGGDVFSLPSTIIYSHEELSSHLIISEPTDRPSPVLNRLVASPAAAIPLIRGVAAVSRPTDDVPRRRQSGMANSSVSDPEQPQTSNVQRQKLAKCMLCQAQMDLSEEAIAEQQAAFEPSPTATTSWQAAPRSDDAAETDVSFGAGQATSRNLLDMICTSRGSFQTPMCKGCTDAFLNEMDTRLKDLDSEYSEYSAALFDLEHTRDARSKENNTARARLDALKQEEADLIAQVERLDTEDHHLSEQMNKMSAALKAVNEREEDAFRRLRNLHRQLLDKDSDEQSLNTQLGYIDSELAELLKMNVLNFAFHIWINGKMGTINGFRLGRLPDVQVEWHEINAALGQAALLLHVMNKRMSVKLEDYEIVPLGAHSCIRYFERDGRVEELPLYGTGGIKLFGTKLDRGLVAYLECFCYLASILSLLADFYTVYHDNHMIGFYQSGADHKVFRAF
ncbi:hypothetical protein L596_005348 [Steinernema carpocapsae]|uniref:Autophagy-related protein 6 n=2 Tax=Steinernema carpocapsae TaxID=34508 RepID=A0A4U8V2C3_STECR|nr:hypothetical protein L596_005348 [Steinernema carpocapsae]